MTMQTGQPQTSASDMQAIQQSVQRGPATRSVPMMGYLRFMPVGMSGGMLGWRDINPDQIGYDVLDSMRHDPLISAALTLCIMPILGQLRSASIQSDDPRTKAFLEHALIDNGLLYRLGRSSLRGSMSFGCAPHEVVWQSEDLSLSYTESDPDTGKEQEVEAWSGPALTFRDVREVNPQTVREILHAGQGDPALDVNPTGGTTSGAGSGVSSSQGTGSTPRAPDWSYAGFVQNPEIVVPAVNSFWYTHAEEYGNLWGRARTRDAYAAYFWRQALWKWWLNWAEKKASPPRVARVPEGTSQDGIPYTTIGVATANALDSMSSVALPNTETPSGKYEWDISELPTSDRVQAFQTTLNSIGQEVLYALFTPEKIFTNPEDTGSYSETSEHADIFLMTLDAELLDFCDAVSRELCTRLVAVNLGPDAGAGRISVTGLTDESRALLKDVFLALLAQPNEAAGIDFDALAEQFNVPVREEAEDEGGDQGEAGAEDETEGEEDGDEGTEAASATEQGEAAQDGATGTSRQAGSPAGARRQAGNSGRRAAGQPDNLILTGPTDTLILSDSSVIRLAFDAARFTVSNDPNSSLGYKVIDNSTGQRLTGFAAEQVIKAFRADQLTSPGSSTAGNGKAAKKGKSGGAAKKGKAPPKPKPAPKPKNAPKAKPKAKVPPKVKAHAVRQAAHVKAVVQHLNVTAAQKALRGLGWVPVAGASAAAAAAANPQSMVTAVPTANGQTIIAAKPIADLSNEAGQGGAQQQGGPNVQAEDVQEDADAWLESGQDAPGDPTGDDTGPEDDDEGEPGLDSGGDESGELAADGEPGAAADAALPPAAGEGRGHAGSAGDAHPAAAAVAQALITQAAEELRDFLLSGLPAEDAALDDVEDEDDGEPVLLAAGDIPPYVAKLPAVRQRQWLDVYQSELKKCGSTSRACIAQAYAAANSIVIDRGGHGGGR